jgi:hypothetical protein
MIYLVHTQGKHTKHYTTKAVNQAEVIIVNFHIIILIMFRSVSEFLVLVNVAKKEIVKRVMKNLTFYCSCYVYIWFFTCFLFVY